MRLASSLATDEQQPRKLKLFLDDVSELNVVPHVNFGDVSPGSNTRRMIMVSSRDGQPFRLSANPDQALNESNSTCEISLDAGGDRSSHIVSLSFVGHVEGRHSGQIELLPTGPYRPASVTYEASVTP
ncbi:MAG: hypothetical protein ACK5Q5_20755 [Planctomycetaceae bacterium]